MPEDNIRLRIWQQNLNKSNKAHWDLINSPIHQEWDLVLLQEPYLDKYGNAKANKNWRVIYPSSHLTDNSTVRSVILVNTQLDTNTWSQITMEGTNDITAIQIRGPESQLSIFNIYNDCRHQKNLDLFEDFLGANKHTLYERDGSHMIWAGDFNLHHPLWDEERNAHLFTNKALEDAQTLIDLMGDYDMVMALPKDIPTLQSMATKNWTRPDNIFCSDSMADDVMTCDTDHRSRGPGTDHLPILTNIDIPLVRKVYEPSRNFRQVDWEKFNKDLASRLENIPDPKELSTDETLLTAIDDLTRVLQDTIEAQVPLTKPTPFSRRWWSKELGKLKEQTNRLYSIVKRYRLLTNHSSHDEYTKTRNAYGEAIKNTKEQHWIDFLENAEDHEMWTANRYISKPVGDGGQTRIPTLKVTDPDGTEREVITNEEKSEALAKAFFPARPAVSSVPPNSRYPKRIKYGGQITTEQIQRNIDKLKPFKAHGMDGIPNVVIKKSAEHIIEYLLFIFRALLKLGVYTDSWREWITIVLRKPGKPRYDIPKAYRPIALLNTLAKLFTSILAEDLTHMCEKHQLIPLTHFGGRPGRATTDSMHLIVNRIKNAWRNGRVVSILFLDIEGAFPNAVTDRLLHNMRKRKVPERYVLVVERILRNRRTKLKFDDFLSDFFEIDNGIGQGDPLSMILYLFYNADLLDLARGKEEAVAFVDDAALITEAETFEKAHDMLADMLNRKGGGKEWSKDHNSNFELSKTVIMDCSPKRVPDPSRPGKTMPKPRPDFILDGRRIKPVTTFKFLGVMFDQELRWEEQAKYALAKATTWTLLFRRLAKSSTGMNQKLMKKLFTSVAIPKMTYAADVWYTPIHKRPGDKNNRGSVGMTKLLARVQRMAALAITGAFRTTATDILNVHANLLPTDLLLHKICQRAAVRISTLPDTHPLHKPARVCARRYVQRHRSPLHHLMHVYRLDPDMTETIQPTRHPPNRSQKFTTEIATTRVESMEDDKNDDADIKIYADGSGYKGNAAAAAALYRGQAPPRVLRYHLGPLTQHTTYEAEAVGTTLAMHLLEAERNYGKVTIRIDNQSVIQATASYKSRPSHYIIDEFLKQTRSIAAVNKERPNYSLRLAWISGHSEVEGNELVDEEAKKAAERKSATSPPGELPGYLRVSSLPYSSSALKQKYRADLKELWRAQWKKSPRSLKMKKYDPSLPPIKFHKEVTSFTRAQTSLLVQLRTGHSPLYHFLYRIKKVDSPICPQCHLAEETLHHYLFECPAYRNQHHYMSQKLGRKATSLKYIFGDGVHILLRFIGKTGRFRDIYGDLTPKDKV